MYSTRFQTLMNQGFALSNKWRFRQWNQHEFDQWINDCQRLLSLCEPEAHFPYFPDHGHIEEIVMLLGSVSAKISSGQVDYMGIL